MLIRASPQLDDVMQAHAIELGDDYPGYRNHAYRVLNLCAALCPTEGEELQRIAVAAAFHDLGIWTARTFDYLGPSVDLACSHLACAGRDAWTPEVSQMIREHHKVSRVRDESHRLIEPFRQADWVDVTHGLLTFGLPRTVLREIFAIWPDAGFHACLARLALRRLGTHPWNPLPMLKV